MRNVPLGQICEINPRKTARINPELQCSFIPMEYVDDQFGVVTKQAIRQIKEVDKGYTFFQDKDILFAKITPCMENGKCSIAKNLINGIGFGSTEFHVIRAKIDVIPEWVYYYFRLASTRKIAEICMTGSAGQKRVPSSFLEEILIPLPSLPEQKRIATILEKADRLRRLRRYALELSGTYLQSVFLEMFGDPTTNPKHWEIRLLSEVGTLDRGKSQHRPRNAAHLYGGPYPFIQTGDVANSNGLITQYSQTYSEAGLAQSRLWKKETLCITIAANIAKTAILDFDACFPDSIVGFIPGPRITIEYVRQWFVSIQARLEKIAPQAAQKNINLEILCNLQIPVPPLSLQQKFAQIVQKYERVRVQQREAERQAEHLFQTLLHKAFQGELTLDEDEILIPDVEVANQQTPEVVGIPEPIDTGVLQMTLPLE